MQRKGVSLSRTRLKLSAIFGESQSLVTLGPKLRCISRNVKEKVFSFSPGLYQKLEN